MTGSAELRESGYVNHYNMWDAETAEYLACRFCGGECKYVGLKAPEERLRDYHAFAQCKECHMEIEL